VSARGPLRLPHPLLSAAGIGLNGCGLFLMPFFVGLAASAFFEVSEVAETGGVLVALGLLFVVGPLVLQIVGVAIKVVAERQFLREEGRLTTRAFLATLHRHLRIVTPRGWAALLTGLWFVVLALGAKWASLGLLAVLALLLFYTVLGGSSFVSTFLVSGFRRGMGSQKGSIVREMSPAVVLSGEPAEERFHLHRVPVPPFFHLLIEDDNPPPLQTESRYAVGAGARRHRVTVSGRFRRTPRGLHRLGPARIWFQDVLGFTRVSVASLATAELKVLPRFRSLDILAPPKSSLQAPDVLTRPHRFASEDWFLFKEYHPGDDTRRIQWRLSVRTGQLMVRKPESREVSSNRVVLLLDSYLPKGRVLEDAIGIEAVLDRLVECWISLARELTERGDKVSLAAVVDDGEGTLRVEQVSGSADPRRWQDLGARARWQGDWELDALAVEVARLEAGGAEGAALHGVAVSSRFFQPPPDALGKASFTWVWLPPQDALGPREPPLWEQYVGAGPGAAARMVLSLVRLPAPTGADENGALRQLQDLWRLHRQVAARDRLRRLARIKGKATEAALLQRGDTVYRLEPGAAGTHRLVGLVAGKGAAGAGRAA
jgi:uncharacterized protein (DUF58 family)